MNQPLAEDVDFLEHFGKKGMKWGVRNDNGHVGERAKTKSIAGADAKFASNANTTATWIKVHNRAADLANDGGVDRINNMPQFKGKDFSRDTPLRRKYYEAHQKAFIDNAEKAASELGTNASGTQKYKIMDHGDGGWSVYLDNVSHAEEEKQLFFIKVNKNAMGHIISLGEPKAEAKHGILDEDISFLEHYGVKGQRWGVKHPTGKNGLVVSSTTKSGARKSDDAIRSQAIRAAVKTEKSTDILSNNELQTYITRRNLEQQYSRMNQTTAQRGAKVASTIVAEVGKQTIKAVITGPIRKLAGLNNNN